jgi:SAM-dependent methyltransferase
VRIDGNVDRADPNADVPKDPLAGSSWSEPGTVAGFVRAAANPALIDYARRNLAAHAANRLLDVGCGAGRNALALAEIGWNVTGADVSWPMLRAAAQRPAPRPLRFVLAPMDALPIADRSIDFIVAHGVWNLASNGNEFRRAIKEAARVCRHGGALFVFTFSRHTLPPSAQPVDGEAIVYTQFSGHPQCFVTAEQLLDELGAAGFMPDDHLPLQELNRPTMVTIRTAGAPVIFQGGFRFR